MKFMVHAPHILHSSDRSPTLNLNVMMLLTVMPIPSYVDLNLDNKGQNETELNPLVHYLIFPIQIVK
jgi:hypothetical protein